MDRVTASDRYRRLSQGPLTIIALAMIPLLLVLLVADLPQAAETAIRTADYVIWAVFAVDYLIRLAFAPQHWRFVWTHPFDLMIVLLPLLRPLVFLRSARALRILRLTRAASFAGRAIHSANEILRRRGLNYVLLVVVVLVFASAALVREFESTVASRHHHGEHRRILRAARSARRDGERR